MKLHCFLIIVVIISAISSGSFYYYLKAKDQKSILQIQEVPMKIQVDDFIGFDLDNTSLVFGTAMLGSYAKRNMTITSNFEEDAITRINISGVMKDWTTVSDNDFILQSGESKNLEFRVTPPPDTEFGNYTSIAIVTFYK